MTDARDRILSRVDLLPRIAGGAAIVGFVLAFYHRWVCDDAFISFRYARNLIRGFGLVFNEGERVEGYTNFLWTVLTAAAMALGVEPMAFSIAGGLAAFAGTLVYLYQFSRRFLAETGSRFLLPLAVTAFALHHHGQLYATSGLETSLFTFLLLAGAFHLWRARRSSELLLAFFLFALSALTRPEGLLFYGLGGLTALVLGPAAFSRRTLPSFLARQLLVHLPLLLIVLPHWLWRYNYYGWPFPNTYYAKSGGGWNVAQGLRYLSLYWNAYYVLYLVPVLCGIFTYRWARGRTVPISSDLPILLILLTPAAALTAYYGKIGGDFMFARFLIPLTPYFFLIIEYLLIRLWGNRPTVLLALSGFVALGTILYNNPYRGQLLPILHGITEESQIYKREVLHRIIGIIRPWGPVFQKAKLRVAIGGTQAFFAYYLDPPLVIEAASGLTDEYLAHRQVRAAGAMMGHEKPAPLEYLQKRRVHLHMNALLLEGRTDYNVVHVVGFPGEGRIITYEKQAMEALGQIPAFRFRRFEEYLDAYLRRLPSIPPEQVARHYSEFRTYYFAHNHDPDRENPIRRALGLKAIPR